MSGSALVVFLKHPRPGGVKTRLAAAIGAQAAADLYRALAERVLEATTPAAGDYERLVFFDPPESLPQMRDWLPGVRLMAQSGDDLGARMADAFARAFARGASRVAIVGTDAPGVSRATVREALSALDTADVVIGPADDGGYYLIALRAPRPELFAGIEWSTPGVRGQTLARAAAAGLSVRELARLRDVDTLEDLRAEWLAVRGLLGGRKELRDAIEAVVGAPGSPAPAAGPGYRRRRRGVPLPRAGASPAPGEVRMAAVKTYLEAVMTLDGAPLKLDPGQVVFSAGDAGGEMFIVRTGSVDLRIGDTLLETVEQGGIFGELALVDPAPRSATAVAGPDCTLVLVDAAAFNDLVHKVPGLALEVMRVMARRLRRTNPTE